MSILKSNQESTFSEYMNIYERIRKEQPGRTGKKIKIALLASSTIKGFEEILAIKCYELGIHAQVYVGNYNQYTQEIFNEQSQLYQFKPDLIILFIDILSLLNDAYFLPYGLNDSERRNLMDEKIEFIKSLLNKLKKALPSKIVLHNFETPAYSPLGIIENKQEFGFIESVHYVNDSLKSAFKGDSQIYLFDYDMFCSKIGKDNLLDTKMYYLGDIKVNPRFMPALCDEYMSYVKPVLSLTKKCIVLDLDNTLWGGILGEDGIDGIKLGPDTEGRPFLEFQKHLLSLFKRGIILAINSKNNLADVLKVFKEHPYMVLKEEHFAAMRINWTDKIANMKTIAEEINIGLDTMVFFDDDKLNREMIRISLPEVKVVDLPEDCSLYSKTLLALNDFNSLQITDEDRQKGEMYVAQRKRKEYESQTTDINEYLSGMGMAVLIEKANHFNIPRISQLTLKTNQFNMTTRRYLEEDIIKFSKNDKFLVLAISAKDKFGDNGIIGAVIIEKKHNQWKIDTFLLSCRIIGRRIEDVILAFIVKEAQKEKASLITGEFIYTEKNVPAKDFYKQAGFKLIEKNDCTEAWAYDAVNQYELPSFIKLELRGRH